MSEQFPNTIEGRQALADVPIPKSATLKTCAGTCGTICDLTAAASFFDVDRKNKDGLKKLCRKCRVEVRLSKKASVRDKRASRIDKMMQQLLGKAQFGGSEVPHIAEVFSKIVALFGGANGLAMAAVQTYLQADPGSPVRQKIVSQVLNLGNQVTQTGAAKVPDELLSEEDLEAKVQRLAKRAKRAKIVNVKVHTPEPEDEGDSTEGIADG